MIARPSSLLNPRAHEERDRGASSIELVFYTPLLMFVILVTVQFALTWHGNQLVSAVARETARVVRTGGGDPQSIEDARERAVDFGDAIGGQSLRIQSVEITKPDADTVRVTVTGRSVEIVTGFAPSVSATVEGPIESFRADD
ncbi:TadE/TadG family type IV pilus assembly protein [Cellulomonas sp. URHE0023]|uniref:TadE/TadG family type IV pilus assembly protein n=1 Tax=Cellulomonas sp. URHE0023 TaxID=1380354 RepID=UPI000A6AA370|nr:TadE family protein [Cellulomonas sp. URHE0023]